MVDVSNLPTTLFTRESIPDFVELGAMVVPRRMIGIKHMLRPACRFIPLPLVMGWQDSLLDDDYPKSNLVSGLRLTDVASGATRAVAAPWMHALYTAVEDSRPKSRVVEVELTEPWPQFTQTFTWQHAALLSTFLIQGVLGVWALSRNNIREGSLVIAGLFLQVLAGLYEWKFPSFERPRSSPKPRACVLHRGALTTQLIVLSHKHDPQQLAVPRQQSYINLEDAAAPRRVLTEGRLLTLQISLRVLLQLANVSLKAVSLYSHSNGFLIPLIFLIGSIASEIIMAFHIPLPKRVTKEPYADKVNRDLLDGVAAICQRTRCASIGFVEAILPDPSGEHVDYNWIRTGVLGKEDNEEVQPHPNHPSAQEIKRNVEKRRGWW